MPCIHKDALIGGVVTLKNREPRTGPPPAANPPKNKGNCGPPVQAAAGRQTPYFLSGQESQLRMDEDWKWREVWYTSAQKFQQEDLRRSR